MGIDEMDKLREIHHSIVDYIISMDMDNAQEMKLNTKVDKLELELLEKIAHDKIKQYELIDRLFKEDTNDAG